MNCETLFLSFWNIGLENIPEGAFVHRELLSDEAKRLIDAAGRANGLRCASADDLFADYHQRERNNHEKLCRVLRETYDIPLSLDDFVQAEQEDGEELHLTRPLVFARLSESTSILVVNCNYVLPAVRGAGAIEFEIAPDSVTFHLFEASSTIAPR
jgi:hypothetical protein